MQFETDLRKIYPNKSFLSPQMKIQVTERDSRTVRNSKSITCPKKNTDLKLKKGSNSLTKYLENVMILSCAL